MFFRIFFCILACAATVAVVPVAVYAENPMYCFIPIALAAVFLLLCVFFKNGCRLTPPQPPETDFINTPEENAEILRSREEPDEKNKEE